MEGMRTNNIIISLLFFLILGVVFWTIHKLRSGKRREAMVEVIATVVSMDQHLSSGGPHPGRIMVYRPTLQYDWKGFKRTLQVGIWSSKFNFEVGDQVTLLVDPEDASNYRFKDFDKDPISFIVFVFVFMAIMIVAAILRG